MIGDPTAFTRGLNQNPKPSLADIVRLSFMKRADDRREQEFKAQQPIREMMVKSEEARLKANEEQESRQKRIDYLSELSNASWQHGDKEGLKKHILEVASIDPGHARKLKDLYWEVDGDTVKQATLEAFSSIVLPEKEIEAKNKVLDTALETINNSDHYLSNVLWQLRSMPAGKERNAFELKFIEKAKELGLLPGSKDDKDYRYQQGAGSYLFREGGKYYKSSTKFDRDTGESQETITPIGQGREFVERGTGLTTEEKSKIKILESTTKEEEKQAVKSGAKFTKDFIAMSKIDTTYEEALAAYEAAAKKDKDVGTGAIRQYMPSVKEEALVFDNIRGRLGLNILSAHTFGSLSESEMRFILQTAIPGGLKGESLKSWLDGRRKAVQKLMSYYKKAADFIGSRNEETGKINTVNDWTKLGKDISPFSLKSDVEYFNEQLNESASQPVIRPELSKDDLRKMSGEELTKKLLESIGE